MVKHSCVLAVQDGSIDAKTEGVQNEESAGSSDAAEGDEFVFESFEDDEEDEEDEWGEGEEGEAYMDNQIEDCEYYKGRRICIHKVENLYS